MTPKFTIFRPVFLTALLQFYKRQLVITTSRCALLYSIGAPILYIPTSGNNAQNANP